MERSHPEKLHSRKNNNNNNNPEKRHSKKLTRIKSHPRKNPPGKNPPKNVKESQSTTFAWRNGRQIFKAGGFWPGEFFRSNKGFCLSNCVSTHSQVSPRILASKVAELLWRSFFIFWTALRHVILVLVAYLFKVEVEGFFDRNTWYYLQNLICYNHFLLYNKQKLLGVYIFIKIASIAKKKCSEKWPVPRSCSEKQNN